LRIAAILSDYDGTLCPTGSLRSQNNNAIPGELESILWTISKRIPVCIVSSKDFNFLHKKTRFANIISCILGIETLVLSRHEPPTNTSNKECVIKDPDTSNLSCVKSSQLSLDPEILQNNSQVLANLAEDIELEFNGQVFVERKFATASRLAGREAILAGVTIDWRHLKYWESFKKTTEPLLDEMINKHTEQRSMFTSPSAKLYIQTYSSHPFIDVYAIKCDKSLAFDNVMSNISHVWKSNNENEGHILYLGDSENDNPAFNMADVSIGIKSDERLSPNLECQYSINFHQLSTFLKGLQANDFVFSGDLFI
jgi:hydroxymethylpyrimidine pyrophosphatase-like HAD family hydrolase